MLKRKVKEPKPKTRQVQSTQQNIPIKDFYNGLVYTKDGSYVKVLEVLPVPFFLKKISEQNKIADTFQSMLKAAPTMLHFKSVSIPANLSLQIKDVEKNIAAETNPNCKRMGEEYRETLISGQNYGVTRKFYVSFPYTGLTKGPKKASLSEITYSLNNDANRLASALNSCGNTVIDPATLENPNEEIAKIFYMLYNRDSFLSDPFSTHFDEVCLRYQEHFMGESFYIPPAEYIAPKQMVFSNSKYLVIDGTYYSFLYIPQKGYNSNVIAGWLDNFINSFNGVDVDVFLKQIKRNQLDGALKRNIGHSEVNANDSAVISDAYQASSEKISAGKYIWNGLNSGQDFYYMSTIITVSGKTPKEVEYKKEEMKKTASTMNVILHENSFECKATFDAVLPSSMYNDNFMEKMRRNVLTSGAASIYPFTTFQIIDSDGLYIADDANGSPTIIDMFNRERFNNPHIFICGESGAGKSVTLLLIALRARIKHLPVFILAPEKQDEFRRVCDAIGGQFISIGVGSQNRINIMEIFPKDASAEEMRMLIDGTSADDSASQLEQKLATLSEFLQIHITDITNEEKQLLNEAILETYRKKGITKENSSLWADEKHTKYKKMPILSDLVSELASKPETIRLSRITKLLTEGTGAHFNGETNINLDNDFVVIGLEHNTKDLLALSIYMAMDFAWSKIKENRTKQKFLVIDEWWKLAFNPLAAEKSLEIAKIARSYGCSMVLSTQQMSDILAVENGKYGDKVLNNCASKILMSMKEKDIYLVKEMVDLTDAECNKISKFKAGQGLFIAGDNRISLKFNPSEAERPLVFTDNETLLKYAEMKKLLQEEERDKQALKNAVNLNEIFETSKEAEKNLNIVELISQKEWEKTSRNKKGKSN